MTPTKPSVEALAAAAALSDAGKLHNRLPDLAVKFQKGAALIIDTHFGKTINNLELSVEALEVALSEEVKAKKSAIKERDELREAASNALPRLTELTRTYKERVSQQHAQCFDEAIDMIRKALAKEKETK